MKMLTNSQKITNLNFAYTVSCYCSVGKKYFVANIDCSMDVGSSYPEYVELTEWFKSLNGEQYSIEELCAEVYDRLAEFSPKYLRVVVEGNSPLHLPVICTKESE